MAKFLVFVLFFLVSAFPAFGKPHNGSYPVSCDDLWNAVSDTLGNAGNYSILATEDAEMKASFIALGARRQRVNSVSLIPKDNGCELQVQFPDSGYADDEESVFKKNVGRSLAKIQAAKPSPPAKPEVKR
jgi:hypothetical protein